jgi:hypothetical protein
MENKPKEAAKSGTKKRINKEVKKLTEVMRDVPEDQTRTVNGLIERAAFMRIQLENYEEDIEKNGSVELFTQSEKVDPYDRERPVVRLHIAMTKNYSMVMRQLFDLVPNKPQGNIDPAYDKFFATQIGLTMREKGGER